MRIIHLGDIDHHPMQYEKSSRLDLLFVGKFHALALARHQIGSSLIEQRLELCEIVSSVCRCSSLFAKDSADVRYGSRVACNLHVCANSAMRLASFIAAEEYIARWRWLAS